MAVLSVVGCLSSAAYQEARLIAEDVVALSAGSTAPLSLHLRPLLHYDWLAFSAGCSLSSSALTEPLVSHSLLGAIGGASALVSWAEAQYGYQDARQAADAAQRAAYEAELQRLSERELRDHVALQQAARGFQYACIELEVDARHWGGERPQQRQAARHRVVLELYPALAPLAVHNFLALCQSVPSSSLPPAVLASLPAPPPASLHYLHCPVHRLVPHAFLQCGDVVDGSGGCSLSASGRPLPVESFALRHSGAGVLSMLSDAGGGIGSQFVLTLAARPEFDGRLVGIGRLVAGEQLIAACNAAGGLKLRLQRPAFPITVAACDAFSGDMLSDDFAAWTQRSTRSGQYQQQQQAAAASDASRPLRPTLLVIGPVSAGKTTLVQGWCTARPPLAGSTTPTTGFELDRLLLPPSASLPGCELLLHGLGGADSIRGYWPAYYDGCHALVFVLDASQQDDGYWQSAAALLADARQHRLIAAKPLLVVANTRRGGAEEKQDGGRPLWLRRLGLQDGADGEDEGGLLSWLEADLVCCSAERTRAALAATLAAVWRRWEELSARVQADVAQRQREAREERERRTRQLLLDKEAERSGAEREAGEQLKQEQEEKTAG